MGEEVSNQSGKSALRGDPLAPEFQVQDPVSEESSGVLSVRSVRVARLPRSLKQVSVRAVLGHWFPESERQEDQRAGQRGVHGPQDTACG